MDEDSFTLGYPVVDHFTQGEEVVKDLRVVIPANVDVLGGSRFRRGGGRGRS